METLKAILEAQEDKLRLTKILMNTDRAELVGEIVQPLEKDRCIILSNSFVLDSVFALFSTSFCVSVIVKESKGIRYVVNCCDEVDQSKLVSGTRVTLERNMFTIMRILPPKVKLLFVD